MSEATLEEVLHERLELIDLELAAGGAKLYERPLLATVKFIQDWVIELETSDGTRTLVADLTIDADLLPENWST